MFSAFNLFTTIYSPRFKPTTTGVGRSGSFHPKGKVYEVYVISNHSNSKNQQNNIFEFWSKASGEMIQSQGQTNHRKVEGWEIMVKISHSAHNPEWNIFQKPSQNANFGSKVKII